MSFDEEWAGLVAEARARQSVGTQLDSAGGESGGSSKSKLKVTPSVLRERAKRAEKTVANEFHDAQKGAAFATREVEGTMAGFACDEALKDYMDSWKKKVAYVKDELGSDGVAGALRSAADHFSGEDLRQGSNFGSGDHGVQTPRRRPGGTPPGKPYKPGDVV